MKTYLETPPTNATDKKFVDDMVNIYLELILMDVNLSHSIEKLEKMKITVEINDLIDKSYGLLKDHIIDKEQITNIIRNSAIRY